MERLTLVIAKLDRLARNVHFLSGLMESGVDFVACDNPHANRLTVHIWQPWPKTSPSGSANGRRPRSQPTRRGVAFWAPRGPDGRRLTREDSVKGRQRAEEVRRANAWAACVDIAPMVRLLRSGGLSLRAIADRLNQDGHATRRGAAWGPMQVSRVLSNATA